MVEVTGLEPAASWSQTKHSTKLSYTSKLPLSVLSDNEQFYYITDSRFCQVFFQQATKKSSKSPYGNTAQRLCDRCVVKFFVR